MSIVIHPPLHTTGKSAPHTPAVALNSYRIVPRSWLLILCKNGHTVSAFCASGFVFGFDDLNQLNPQTE